jgi:uncharacterized protein DUF3352
MQMKLLRTALLVALSAIVLFLAACGSDSSSDDSSSADLGPDPATMAPADAPFYAQVVVKPSGSIGDDLNSALSKLLGTEDPAGMIRDSLDQSLSSDPSSGGITYTDDIEPWIGTRAGIFVTGYDAKTSDPDAAAAVAVTDTDGAQAFIDKLVAAGSHKPTDETYNGVDYKYDSSDDSAVGISGDFMLIGTKQGFEDAVDAGSGDSLLDNTDASSALGDAPDSSLFSVYVDTPAIVDLIKTSGQLSASEISQFDDQLKQLGDGPIEAWGTATDSTFAIGGSAPTPEGSGGPSDLIASFPADSWLAFATANFGETLQNSIDQFAEGFQAGLESSAPAGFDTSSIDPISMFKQATGIDLKTDLAWIGDAGGFVEGSSVFGLGGGLVLESNDDQAATDSIDKLESALSSNAQLKRQIQVTPSDSGFSVQANGAPIGAEVGLQDGKVVAAAGAATVDDVVSSSDTLDGSDRFNTATDALGDGSTPSFFLDFGPIVSLVESSGQAGTDPDYQSAKPYLDALDYLVSGSAVDGDRTTGSIVLGVKEASTESADATSAVIMP